MCDQNVNQTVMKNTLEESRWQLSITNNKLRLGIEHLEKAYEHIDMWASFEDKEIRDIRDTIEEIIDKSMTIIDRNTLRIIKYDKKIGKNTQQI